MGDHDAPSSLLGRWQETEPVRLWLYGISFPVTALFVGYGWITTEQAGLWLAVAGGLLGATVVGTEAARHVAWSPDYAEQQLRQEGKAAYADGVRAAMHRTPDVVAGAVEREPGTTALTVANLGRCRRVENGDRCTLPPHPEGVEHRFD